MKSIINTILLVFIICLLLIGVGRGVDKSINNQDVMLCESALTSGNQHYLKKCACYYQSGDINCIK